MQTFEATGLLPEGVHFATEETFLQSFVAGFPDMAHRAVLADGFFRLRLEAVSYGLSGLQWVDGSFVTKKLYPRDIDVVTFVHSDLVASLSQDSIHFFTSKLNGRDTTRIDYSTHAFGILVFPPDHIGFESFESPRSEWRKFWGQDRDPGRRKGFICMPFGDASLVPYIDDSR